jgi:hypothetical protein
VCRGAGFGREPLPNGEQGRRKYIGNLTLLMGVVFASSFLTATGDESESASCTVGRLLLGYAQSIV